MEKKKITIIYQDGDGGSSAFYTGDTIAKVVNAFSNILKDSMRYYKKENGVVSFEILLNPCDDDSDEDKPIKFN